MSTSSQSVEELIKQAEATYRYERATCPFWGFDQWVNSLQALKDSIFENFFQAQKTVELVLQDEKMWQLVQKCYKEKMAPSVVDVIKSPQQAFCLFSTGTISICRLCLVVDIKKELHLCVERYHEFSHTFLVPLTFSDLRNGFVDSMGIHLGLQLFTKPETMRQFLVNQVVWSARRLKERGH